MDGDAVPANESLYIKCDREFHVPFTSQRILIFIAYSGFVQQQKKPKDGHGDRLRGNP
jgi:hypothetical protein